MNAVSGGNAADIARGVPRSERRVRPPSRTRARSAADGA
ncbi:hypothetical protein DB32_001926 [Sandaracinus amylolyticus]|uniref:Uncharacterized protein n=1 Tax=Sandaracinus amylolyticus TaxID=927083 RepID=A0A0F6W1C8_9BACT|nr:hypothetical protein DB32_001926 [Sandaracinus amylolyticus]